MHYKATKTSVKTMDDLLFGEPVVFESESENPENGGTSSSTTQPQRRRVYYGLHLAQALPFPSRFLSDAYEMREKLQIASDAQIGAEDRTQTVWKQKKQVVDLHEALVHIGEMYSLNKTSGDGSGGVSNNQAPKEGIEESKIKEWLKFLQHKFVQEVTIGK